MSTVLFACMDADTLGGIQRVTHTVAQGLAGRGHEVHVLGLHRAESPFRYVERPGYHRHVLHRTPMGAKVSRLGARRERRMVADLCRRLDPGFAVLTSPGAVTRLRSLLPGHLLPIGQYHGSYQHARGSWHLGSVRGHYGRLEKAVFVSDDDAWLFSEHALLPNAWSIPNPLPAWPARAADLAAHRVLGVGRLEGVKRFDRLISAFALACRDVAGDWELHLIGEGEDRERLREHALACEIADRVVFRGGARDGDGPRVSRRVGAGAVQRARGVASGGRGGRLARCAGRGVRRVGRGAVAGARPPDRGAGAPGRRGRVRGGPGQADGLGAGAAAAGRRRARHVEAFRLERVLDRWEALFEHILR
nr:hypothetical protein GCM10020093_089730 [Planobispora longispora]